MQLSAKWTKAGESTTSPVPEANPTPLNGRSWRRQAPRVPCRAPLAPGADVVALGDHGAVGADEDVVAAE
eukprot:5182332-Prymnesium_polylepis.1